MANTQVGEPNQRAFGQKADFIRAQPESMSAKEVVEAAAKEGIQISVNHVYNLRSAAARRANLEPTATAGMGSRRAKGRGQSTTPDADIELQLRQAIGEVGLRRTREIFDALEAVFDRTMTG